MFYGRRLGLAIVVVVAALIVLDVVAPRLAQLGRVPPVAGGIVVLAVVAYIIGTILAANGVRLRLPALRRPRRLRSVRKGPGSASDFIDQFERRNRR